MALPNPTEDDLTLEELLSQFDDDDHGLLPPPPPVPPTNSLEQYDYIEELDRLLLQLDDEAQRQRDGDPAPTVLPPPEEEAAVSSFFGQEQMYEALRVDCEEEEVPVMLLPPPDEYKDMDDTEAGPDPQPQSLLLQALAAPTAFSRALQPREKADLDSGAASSPNSEFVLAGESSTWGQEPTWDHGSQCLALEPVPSWPNEGGDVYQEGVQQRAQDALYQDHWQRSQTQEHHAPESSILSDLSKFRADELQACVAGQVHFTPCSCSPSDSPYIRACFQLATASVGDADSGIESVSSLSPPDGEMSPVCSPPSSNCIAPLSSVSPAKPCKLQSVSVLSTMLSQEPEPTKSSTLLNSLLLNNNNATSSAPPPNPMSALSITEAEEDSSIEAAIFALKVIAIDPNEMTLSKESSTAALAGTTEVSLFQSHDDGGGDPTGLSFLHGDEVPIRSALQDEDATPRLPPARRKRPASVVEESWAQEPQGWTTKANFPSHPHCRPNRVEWAFHLFSLPAAMPRSAGQLMIDNCLLIRKKSSKLL